MSDIDKMLEDLEKEINRVNGKNDSEKDQKKVEMQDEEAENGKIDDLEIVETHDEQKEDKKNEKIAKIFISSVAVILAALAIGYVVTRESKKGKVKFISNKPTSSMSDNVTQDSNVKETTNIIENDNVINKNNFENLVSNYVKNNSDKYSNISTGDILKFIALANIDELSENNAELSSQLFNSQSKEEYLNDAAKVIESTVMYDFNVWNKTRSTEDFIKVSDSIIGSQKEQMIKIEDYVNRIADAVNADNAELVNSIVAEFLEDMNSGELSKLDDGVGFVSQIYIAVIADGIAKDYLNQENFDMLQILKGSEKYISNIFAVYDKCNSNGKTLGR